MQTADPNEKTAAPEFDLSAVDLDFSGLPDASPELLDQDMSTLLPSGKLSDYIQ